MSENSTPPKISRRAFLRAGAAAGILIGAGVLGATPFIRKSIKNSFGTTGDSGKPNVVVIMVDDLGYGDTRLYGNSNANTPNIQSIADNGILFTQAYSAAPVCNPSRSAIFSSIPPGYYGADNNYSGRKSMDRLPAYTLANVLKDKGYTSKYVGKWDLGTEDSLMPVARGFDDFFGIPGGISNYYSKKQNTATQNAWHLDGKKAVKGGQVVSNWPIIVRKYNSITEKYVPASEQEYLTDAFTREALEFIDSKAAGPNPFFLYLSYNAVHVPLQAPDDHYQKYANIRDSGDRIFAAMVDAMDEGVGKVLNKLGEKGVLENTLVVFVTDHGPEAGSSGGLKGRKYTLFEGGIRIPFIVQWPAKYVKNKKFDEPVSLMDILPTIATAAGHDSDQLVKEYKMEGADLTPFLIDKTAMKRTHQDLYWRYAGDHKQELDLAIRSGDMKYIQVYNKQKALTEYLFDISKDMKETTNLISDAKYKSVAAELKSKLEKWDKDHPINSDVGDGKNNEP
jgi:arylsulfatase A-like enzyme